MTDRTRNLIDRDQQQSSEPRRESPEIADDRGRARNYRSFSGDREHDELGSEMEDDLAVEDRDDMSMDDGLGEPGRNDR